MQRSCRQIIVDQLVSAWKRSPQNLWSCILTEDNYEALSNGFDTEEEVRDFLEYISPEEVIGLYDYLSCERYR